MNYMTRGAAAYNFFFLKKKKKKKKKKKRVRHSRKLAIHANIFGIRPETIFEIIAMEKYENLGFDTQANGRADVWWKGSPDDFDGERKCDAGASPSANAE